MEKKNRTTVTFLLNCLFTAAVPPVIILSLAGDWRWLAGWIFSLWFDVMVLLNYAYMYWYNLALLAERSRLSAPDQKKWDKYLIIAIYLVAMAWLVIMPLDAKRFGWTAPFPVWVRVLGGLLLIPSCYLLYRPAVENAYLSTLVRIQSERKQRVISTGVYGFVRHPLYLGALLMIVGAPLLLSSKYGLLIGGVGIVMTIGRIIGEEKLLVRELEGYEDYKKEVKYRLIPFIW